MSSSTKKFGTPYLCVMRGGGHIDVSGGYSLFEFRCSCGKAEINCPCIRSKKWVADKTSVQFKELNLPEHGERIIIEG